MPRDAVRIRLNSRALLEESLRESVLREAPDRFEALCVVIDKLDKIGPEAMAELDFKYSEEHPKTIPHWTGAVRDVSLAGKNTQTYTVPSPRRNNHYRAV